ncbi:MAG TPA: ATP-binding protein [Bryobacteraceae bacterium]|nr:ATP-binding protein [Bryobacteraceae bacterium]
MNAVETCAICGGSGWKIVEREGVSGAEKCECANAGREQRVEARANIPPLYQNASVDNFILPADNPVSRTQLASVVLTVRAYVREYPNVPKPGLLFIGAPGTGKTHLAAAALRSLIARGFEGVFYDFQALLNHIRSGYDVASGTMDREAYRSALEAEILVLDDLGAHRVTDWVEDTVTSIVTQRCNHRRATIVTTNLRDPEVGDQRGSGLQDDIHSKYFLEERIGMRARSRLFEMCKLIKMPDVEDYRLKRRS